jgi:uncharacterized protein YjcR
MLRAELESIYGRSMKPKELAEFLGIDTRTVIKYADRWGGVEVCPGKYRFFENRIKEVLDAKFNNETRLETMERNRHGQGRKTGQIVSGCHKKILSECGSVGKGNTKETRKSTDRHGLLYDF